MILLLFNGSIVSSDFDGLTQFAYPIKFSLKYFTDGPGIAIRLYRNSSAMISEFNNLSTLRGDIIAETQVLLRGMYSGASDEQLQAILRRIRDKEHELLQQEGVVLHPDMWRILHSRLRKRNLEYVE